MNNRKYKILSALVLSLFAANVSAQLDEFPRTPSGKPDFSGIWQAMTKAHYDIEPHAAAYGPHPGQMGTLFIPNTLALIKGSPHGDNARRLADFLLSPEVEKKLADGPSAQIPLNRSVNMKLRVESPQTIRAMDVDFADAASHWDKTARFLRDQLAR